MKLFSVRPSLRPLRHILQTPVIRSRIVKSRIVLVKNSNEFINSIVNSSHWVGKSIILYTMFYCSMQWYTIRKEIEAIQKLKKQKKDKK